MELLVPQIVILNHVLYVTMIQIFGLRENSYLSFKTLQFKQ